MFEAGEVMLRNGKFLISVDLCAYIALISLLFSPQGQCKQDAITL